MSDGFVSIPLAPAPERVPIPAPSPSPSDNTTVTGKETKETRIDRIKRLSTSFFRSGGAGGVNGERRRASSTSTGTSTSTLGDSSTEAEGHGHGHGNAGASSIDKFMGSSPFSVIVVGGAGSGKASLVDRVFGVARVARNAVLVADPQTPLPDDPAAAAATVTLSAKQLKMLDVVRVTGFDAVAEVVALSAADVARIDADICWYFADPHFESDKRVDDTPGDRKHNTHNDENNNYDNDNKYNTLDSAFAAVDALAIRRLLDARVPVLIVLTHADLLPQEKQNAVRNHIASLLKPSDNWDFAPVANPPPPVCSDCGSIAILKPIPASGFNGWFCSNEQCDLYGVTAFKINNFPMSKHALQLAPLLQKTKSLLLNNNFDSTESTNLDSSAAENYKTNDNITPAEQQTTTTTTTTTTKKSNLANRRFQIAQLVDTHSKFEYAKVFVITSTLLSAGFGANPIPFIDAPLLVATQFTLITSLCGVYGLPNASTYYGLFKYVLAAPLLGLVGADLLKLIPGVGTVVGGVVDVVICATLTLSLGIAVVKICEIAINERNARAYGVGQGRPEFKLDARVGAVFKEVYTTSKDAIKGMLTSGSLSKEGLVGLMQQSVPEDDKAFLFDETDDQDQNQENGVGIKKKKTVAVVKDEQEIEGLAYEMMIAAQQQKEKEKKH